jgi:diacylglycerol O-acyltransferase / wax synthase
MVQRLAAADLMLVWPETKGWPQDIGALAILDGGRFLDANGRFLIEPAREHIRRRLHLVPRFRQLPVLATRRARVAAVG